ncbi:3-oxoadipate enol-lactonase i [Ophiostoma piceae UAMH 11346]|uniref:3-oxoadipate enol-lactonase i n=1 Tax=Ophiostoma piceae (strain UAMH 11346) TaxID=1262450 RepID=S3D1K3_OPHP1|nr:3-oxoadipate enol-lactonase i [Ophiostoma piceae UAMH 11346]
MAGMLFVTMQPRPGLSLDQFHEWYNNEHGPTRLRLPQIFSTGQRYKASDSNNDDGPPFVATYDVTDMAFLTQPIYTDLRAHRSPREAETIGQVDVKRYMFDWQSTKQLESLESVDIEKEVQMPGTVLVYVDVTIKETASQEDAEKELARWYDEEHFGMLSKVPGWLRSRRFRTSTLDLAEGKPLRIVSLHEYRPHGQNGLGGPEHKASMDTPWRTEVFDKYVAAKGRRTWELFYAFGPAPRDLQHLARLPQTRAFSSADGRTTTTPDNNILESFVAAADGLEIPYRLEGNPAPDAPVLAFSNSLLTSLHMWDDLVAIIKQKRPEYQILRYDTRGRHAIPAPPVPATMEMLADDLATLVNALRIPKLAALVGVSLGGATTLQFALKYPKLVSKFVSCDFNIAGSPANTSAWKERIAIAEGSDTGMETLAGITVSRWFAPVTLTEKPATTQAMTDMVAANSIEGFKYSCQALWAFDLKDAAANLQVPGLFVAGEADGKGALAKAIDGFRPAVGTKSGQRVELRIVPDAGHLPMFENPDQFWETIKHFV